MAKAQPTPATKASGPRGSGGAGARPSGSSGSGSRRAQLASFETARKKEARRRTIILVAICTVLAIGILSFPVYYAVQDAKLSNATLDSLGVGVAAAACDPVSENAATGNQEHKATGTPITYDQTPPDSGPHWDTPAAFSKHFYAKSERPAVETLVHNLEHGYTVAWYRDGAPKDQVDALKRIAKTFASSEEDNADKFIAAPWTDADGAGFPDGKNVVLARWTADPQNPGDAASQKGVRQACGAVSGAAVQEFMVKYPEANAPEPNGA